MTGLFNVLKLHIGDVPNIRGQFFFPYITRIFPKRISTMLALFIAFVMALTGIELRYSDLI